MGRDRVKHHGINLHLGSYCTPDKAARAWDAKALELRGPDTYLNFPGEAPATQLLSSPVGGSAHSSGRDAGGVSDGGGDGGAVADDGGPLWAMGSELMGHEAQLYRATALSLYLDPFSLGDDISAEPCGNGRSYLAKGARLPQAIPLLEELEELVVAWVWRRLGREPTLAEVALNLPPKLPTRLGARVYIVGADDPCTPLHGQHGVELSAAQEPGSSRGRQQGPLAVRGSMIGAYQCYFMHRYEARQAAPPDWYIPSLPDGTPSAVARAPGVIAAYFAHDLDRFAIDVPIHEFYPICKVDKNLHQFPDSCKAASGTDRERQLAISAFPPGRCGNIMCFVSDPRLLPTSRDNAGSSAGGHTANATIVNVRALQVPMEWLERRKRDGWGDARPAKQRRSNQRAELIDLAGGWAFPLMVTTRDVVEKDAKLRYAYDQPFWAGHEKGRVNCERAVTIAKLERQVELLQKFAENAADLSQMRAPFGGGAGGGGSGGGQSGDAGVSERGSSGDARGGGGGGAHDARDGYHAPRIDGGAEGGGGESSDARGGASGDTRNGYLALRNGGGGHDAKRGDGGRGGNGGGGYDPRDRGDGGSGDVPPSRLGYAPRDGRHDTPRDGGRHDTPRDGGRHDTPRDGGGGNGDPRNGSGGNILRRSGGGGNVVSRMGGGGKGGDENVSGGGGQGGRNMAMGDGSYSRDRGARAEVTPNMVWGSQDAPTGGRVDKCRVALHKLPFEYDARDLAEMMQPCGTVLHVRMQLHNESKSKGRGIVVFESPSSASAAVDRWNGESEPDDVAPPPVEEKGSRMSRPRPAKPFFKLPPPGPTVEVTIPVKVGAGAMLGKGGSNLKVLEDLYGSRITLMVDKMKVVCQGGQSAKAAECLRKQIKAYQKGEIGLYPHPQQCIYCLPPTSLTYSFSKYSPPTAVSQKGAGGRIMRLHSLAPDSVETNADKEADDADEDAADELAASLGGQNIGDDDGASGSDAGFDDVAGAAPDDGRGADEGAGSDSGDGGEGAEGADAAAAANPTLMQLMKRPVADGDLELICVAAKNAAAHRPAFDEIKLRFTLGKQTFYESRSPLSVDALHKDYTSAELARCPIGLDGKFKSMFNEQNKATEVTSYATWALLQGFTVKERKTSVTVHMQDYGNSEGGLTGVSAALRVDPKSGGILLRKIKSSTAKPLFMAFVHPKRSGADYRFKLLAQYVMKGGGTQGLDRQAAVDFMATAKWSPQLPERIKLPKSDRFIVDCVRVKSKTVHEGEFQGVKIRFTVSEIIDNGKPFACAGGSCPAIQAALNAGAAVPLAPLRALVAFCDAVTEQSGPRQVAVEEAPAAAATEDDVPDDWDL
ncbi:hypothetical protein FOA52_008307 [Chlamydomonas sp. UWO 241]|nr:hypothetical protein FOA52_008307 [Chlamydomonas sp. UWO 241]